MQNRNAHISHKEVPFPTGTVLISKTDTKGIITYVNDAFVAISGYSREELVGKSHNVVRHPDMPQQAFKWLWDTLKNGHPWRGVVKNRCKNGDSLKEIMSASVSVASRVDHIAKASSEQTAAGKQVAESLERITALVEHNTRSSAEAKSAAEELAKSAVELRRAGYPLTKCGMTDGSGN